LHRNREGEWREEDRKASQRRGVPGALAPPRRRPKGEADGWEGGATLTAVYLSFMLSRINGHKAQRVCAGSDKR
jgi:hypothetical protein